MPFRNASRAAALPNSRRHLLHGKQGDRCFLILDSDIKVGRPWSSGPGDLVVLSVMVVKPGRRLGIWRDAGLSPHCSPIGSHRSCPSVRGSGCQAGC